MDTRIMTLCEVCNQPKLWHREQEKGLMVALAIKCPYCHQYSKIPKELKREIKKRWGMFTND